jgi:hypothetical protein
MGRGPWTTKELFGPSSHPRTAVGGLHYGTASACLFLSRFALARLLTHVLPLHIDRPGLAIPIIITRLQSAHGFLRVDRPNRDKTR